MQQALARAEVLADDSLLAEYTLASLRLWFPSVARDPFAAALNLVRHTVCQIKGLRVPGAPVEQSRIWTSQGQTQ